MGEDEQRHPNAELVLDFHDRLRSELVRIYGRVAAEIQPPYLDDNTQTITSRMTYIGYFAADDILKYADLPEDDDEPAAVRDSLLLEAAQLFLNEDATPEIHFGQTLAPDDGRKIDTVGFFLGHDERVYIGTGFDMDGNVYALVYRFPHRFTVIRFTHDKLAQRRNSFIVRVEPEDLPELLKTTMAELIELESPPE